MFERTKKQIGEIEKHLKSKKRYPKSLSQILSERYPECEESDSEFCKMIKGMIMWQKLFEKHPEVEKSVDEYYKKYKEKLTNASKPETEAEKLENSIKFIGFLCNRHPWSEKYLLAQLRTITRKSKGRITEESK